MSMYPAPVYEDSAENRQFTETSSPYDRAVPGSVRRGPWSPEEDRKLLDIISVYGPSNWVRVSLQIRTRSPKQCRERYHQNLKPSLNRNPITYEEGVQIEQLVGKYGKKWAEIARHMAGRSDNAIKNWWNGGANRRRRATQVSVPIGHQRPLMNGSTNMSRTPSATELHNGPTGQYLTHPGLVPAHDASYSNPVQMQGHLGQVPQTTMVPAGNHMQQFPFPQVPQHPFPNTPNPLASQMPNPIHTQVHHQMPNPATSHMLPLPEHAPAPQASRSNSIPHNFNSQHASSNPALPKPYIKLPTLPPVAFNTTIFGESGHSTQNIHHEAEVPNLLRRTPDHVHLQGSFSGIATRPPTPMGSGSVDGNSRASYSSTVSSNLGTAPSVSAGSSIGSVSAAVPASHTIGAPSYHYNNGSARPAFSPSMSAESATSQGQLSDSHFSPTMAGHMTEDLPTKRTDPCYVQAAHTPAQGDHFVVPPFKSLVQGIQSPPRENPGEGIRVANLIN